jgi:hemoglobin
MHAIRGCQCSNAPGSNLEGSPAVSEGTREQPSPRPIQPRTRARRQAALFERIGGRATVEHVVEDFYDRVERDEVLRPIFPEDLSAGRAKQLLFLEQWLGGEHRYSERYGHPRLRRRHFPFVIDERAVGRWLKHMGDALRAAGVEEPEFAEIMAGLGPLAKHMANAGDDVPREPLVEERLD